MRTRKTLEQRINRTLAAVERVQERAQDQALLGLIDDSLMRSLEQLSGATSDEDFSTRLEQLHQLEQGEKQAYTPGQRQALKRFDLRYHPGQAKEELLLLLAPDRDQEEV